ncbi:MAG: hypothetical protein ACRDM8_01555, partial [Gaiellaceae bacterium]
GGPWRLVRDLVSATRFTDRGLPNDVRFRYRIQSYDAAGNASAAAYTVERPSRIFAPEYDAALNGPPMIDWTTVRKATYYNLQVWRNGRKILSRWPARARYAMDRSWLSLGQRFRLTSGTYYGFVWAGFGPRAAADYGRIVGWTRFVVR